MSRAWTIHGSRRSTGHRERHRQELAAAVSDPGPASVPELESESGPVLASVQVLA